MSTLSKNFTSSRSNEKRDQEKVPKCRVNMYEIDELFGSAQIFPPSSQTFVGSTAQSMRSKPRAVPG